MMLIKNENQIIKLGIGVNAANLTSGNTGKSR
jgi:hypothetical protein